MAKLYFVSIQMLNRPETHMIVCHNQSITEQKYEKKIEKKIAQKTILACQYFLLQKQ